MSRVLPLQHDGAASPGHVSAMAQRVEDAGGPDPIAGFDAGLRLSFVNQAAADIAGMPVAALIGLGVERLAELGWLGADIAPPLDEVRSSRIAQRVQTRQSVHGMPHWFDVQIVPRGIDEVACFARDITEIKRAEEQLRDSAGRDSLTGLLNHAAFHNAVSQALATGGPGAQEVALVLFDLDYLKLLNDVHGHQAGDQALRAVADALRATTRGAARSASSNSSIRVPGCSRRQTSA